MHVGREATYSLVEPIFPETLHTPTRVQLANLQLLLQSDPLAHIPSGVTKRNCIVTLLGRPVITVN